MGVHKCICHFQFQMNVKERITGKFQKNVKIFFVGALI